ncbi:putative adenylate and Guanylate cyclase catalytic domain protein [Mycobacterium xenopi 4042]|uniref:Putative adenylate and Guanylate cyclase catalytic domain protein n=1 Tax=Mycobacterium xenopi 4042 TaxID=1299334 RepID=X8E6E2_MYCXE|nr:putative adenylate and Guanylate cyclase catalytic domain protein [Mycobacterium xenopi 4042]
MIVDEVDRHRGLVNKFEGDAVLAVFGAPNRLECPEDEALAAARAIADRLEREVPSARRGSGWRPDRSSPATSARRSGLNTR